MKTLPSRRQGFILGLHPTARGVGWALFESPLAPVDWGIVRSNKNAACLVRIEQIVEQYAPAVVVLEQFEHGPVRKAGRIQMLCRAVVHLAANRGAEARLYSRAAIRTCFSSVGAVTRYEIAQAIAAHIDALRHRLPPPRKAGMDQDARLSIFNAAALAMTYFAITGDTTVP